MGGSIGIIFKFVPRIPDKDREFPLFPKGNERVRFDYGVFLLNKNIAQLRWFCGEATSDAKPTLKNLAGLLQLCSTSRFIKIKSLVFFT